jgi:hypothetical protein
MEEILADYPYLFTRAPGNLFTRAPGDLFTRAPGDLACSLRAARTAARDQTAAARAAVSAADWPGEPCSRLAPAGPSGRRFATTFPAPSITSVS